MNRKKIIYIVAAAAIGLFCLYHAVYFDNLTERKQELAKLDFSPTEMVDDFWNNGMDNLSAGALDLGTFDSLLQANPAELIEKYGRTLGIGAAYSFLVKGTVRVASVEEERFLIESPGKTEYGVRTGFIFSNTVREASGAFDIDDFENTMDFNMISSEINRRIVEQVAAPLSGRIEKGSRFELFGAVDVNPKKSSAILDIVPLSLKPAGHE